VPSDTIRAALVRRLRTSSGISDDDVKEIEALPIAVRQYPAEAPVVRDGERATDCCLIADGFCARSKTIASGKRQILSIHIPGEIPDLMSLFLHVMDHDLSTLTPCTLGFISHETLRKLHQRSPSVAEMFWRDTLIDAAKGAATESRFSAELRPRLVLFVQTYAPRILGPMGALTGHTLTGATVYSG